MRVFIDAPKITLVLLAHLLYLRQMLAFQFIEELPRRRGRPRRMGISRHTRCSSNSADADESGPILSSDLLRYPAQRCGAEIARIYSASIQVLRPVEATGIAGAGGAVQARSETIRFVFLTCPRIAFNITKRNAQPVGS